MKLLSETTETVNADRIVNIGGVDYVIPTTDDVKPVVYATLNDILSQIKEYSHVLDTTEDALDDLKRKSESAGVTFIVLNASGPGGGNPEVVFSHDDEDALNKFIFEEYFQGKQDELYEDYFDDDTLYIRSEMV